MKLFYPGATRVALLLLLTLGAAQLQGGLVASAQDAATPAVGSVASQNVRFSLGVSNQQVAEAWNPVRLLLRDVPPATLTVHVDQGTLRSGQVPLTATYEVRGGAGVSLFDELLYLPSFSTLSWRLATAERVIASGAVSGRDADARPLDLVLTSNPGSFRAPYFAAFGADARLVDVTASALPLEPAAYDGVRSLIIDGSAAAPSLEAVAAAASGGVIVTLAGPLPASHDELLLLLGGGTGQRIGAGALLYVDGGRDGAVEAVRQAQVPNRQALTAALLDMPLVAPPLPMKESTLVLAAALFAAAVLVLLRWAGAPGLTAALALAGLASLVAWQMLRPESPRLEATASIALAGGDLALSAPALEVLTRPRATLNVPQRARPMRAQAYWVDGTGTNVPLERWRSVLLELEPRLLDAHLGIEASGPVNRGAGTLYQVYVVGHGLLGQLAPFSNVVVPGEAGAEPWLAPLAALLPDGAVLARSECLDECSYWAALPPLTLVAARTPEPPPGSPVFEDPFRGTPGRVGDDL